MVIGQISLADQLYKANLNKFADIKVVSSKVGCLLKEAHITEKQVECFGILLRRATATASSGKQIELGNILLFPVSFERKEAEEIAQVLSSIIDKSVEKGDTFKLSHISYLSSEKPLADYTMDINDGPYDSVKLGGLEIQGGRKENNSTRTELISYHLGFQFISLKSALRSSIRIPQWIELNRSME